MAAPDFNPLARLARLNQAATPSSSNHRQSEYVSKTAAAELLGLSVRRILELSLSGAIKRHQVTDPVTKRRQTVFLAAELDRFIEIRAPQRNTASPVSDSTRQPATDFVSKAAAAEQLGLSARRVLELAASGLITRGYMQDPVTNRRQSAFSAADLARLVHHRRGTAAPPDRAWLTVEEAAHYSGLPASFLISLIEERRLGAIDVGEGPPGGRYRVARCALDAISAPRLPGVLTGDEPLTAAPIHESRPIQRRGPMRSLTPMGVIPAKSIATKSPIESNLVELDQKRLELSAAGVAANTVSGYGYDWRMFCDWAKSRGLDSLPATAETVALYLTDLLTQGKKITTARRRRCAILHEHVAQGLPAPDSAEIGTLLLGAQRRRREKPRQMKPISVQELALMSAKLAGMGTRRALRDRALLVVGFASALRRSNLGALNLADIEFVPEGVILTIDREKNDQEGKGRLIGIARGQHDDTCPVRVLQAWLHVRGDKPGPLFPNFDRRGLGGRLSGDGICRLVKKALTLIGIDPVQHGAHSLRAGFCTAAGEANVGELVIASQTGHRSMLVLRSYFRRSDLWRANASSSLGL